MNIGVIDFETTSDDPEKCFITEVGFVLYDPDNNKINEIYSRFVRPDEDQEKLTPEASEVTGITEKQIEIYGHGLVSVIDDISDFIIRNEILYLCAHNGLQFDKKIYGRFFDSCPDSYWIDTMTHLPFPDSIKTRKLTHLCYEHNYYIQNAHRAIFDCFGCAHLLKTYWYDKETILKKAQSKNFELLAVFPDPWWKDKTKEYPEGVVKTKAKAAGFKFDWDRKEWLRPSTAYEYDQIRDQLDFPHTIKEI